MYMPVKLRFQLENSHHTRVVEKRKHYYGVLQLHTLHLSPLNVSSQFHTTYVL